MAFLSAQLNLSDMDARARAVFKDIVQSYLETGQPIGSRTLALSGGRTLSPATIRNTMADLTRYGLLAAPHVSAGRIPTQLGLRLFVDGLLELGELSPSEQTTLERQLSRGGDDVRGSPTAVLEQASSLLAGLAGGAGLVLTPEQDTAKPVRHVEFVNLGGEQTLVVIVYADGQVENRLMPYPAGLLPSALEHAGNFLSARLKGRTLSDAQEDLIALLDNAEDADGVKIFIGTENPMFSLSGSSVVVAPYRDAQQRIIGAVGVIGPTRLNYGRVIPVVDYTAQLVGKLIGAPKT